MLWNTYLSFRQSMYHDEKENGNIDMHLIIRKDEKISENGTSVGYIYNGVQPGG